MASSTEPTGGYAVLIDPEWSTIQERIEWDIFYKGAKLCPEGLHLAKVADVGGVAASFARVTIGGDAGTRQGVESDCDSLASPASISSTLVDPTDFVRNSHTPKMNDDQGTVQLGKHDTRESTHLAFMHARSGPLAYRGLGHATIPGGPVYTSSTRPRFRHQLYAIGIDFVQTIPSSRAEGLEGDPLKSHFDLVLDTGAQTSWLIGEGCRALVGGEVRDWDDPVVVAEISTEGITLPAGLDYVLNHDYGCDELGIWGFKEGAVRGSSLYSDGKQVEFTLMRQPVRMTIGRSFRWPHEEGSTSDSPLEFSFSMGVAYAISPVWFRIPYSGILGVGPGRYQTGFENVPDVDGFGYSLARQKATRAPSTGRSGIIHYFALSRDPGNSFWAYNNWPLPFKVPPWTDPIPAVNPDGWEVQLLSISFEKELANYRLAYPDFTYTFNGDTGIPVYLDTGSSMSWLPAGLTTHFRLTVFKGNENLAIHERQGDTTQFFLEAGETFSAAWTDPSEWHVTLAFRGRAGTVIEVEVPFAPFIATRDGDSEANEGLGHYKSAIGISPDSTYILGLPN